MLKMLRGPFSKQVSLSIIVQSLPNSLAPCVDAVRFIDIKKQIFCRSIKCLGHPHETLFTRPDRGRGSLQQ